MSSSFKITTQNNTTTISIHGRYDFALSHQIEDQLDNIPRSANIVIDLNDCDHMDSGGVGNLLLLRNLLASDTSPIQIINASGLVIETLKMTQMDIFFDIKAALAHAS